MARKKSKASLEAELKAIKTYGVGFGLTKLLTVATPWIGGGFICVQIKDAFIAWAGKSTIAFVDLSARLDGAAFDCPVSVGKVITAIGFAFLCAIAGVGYGILQRRLRLAAVSSLAPFKIELERREDAKRSSSGLAHDGQTHPDDK